MIRAFCAVCVLCACASVNALAQGKSGQAPGQNKSGKGGAAAAAPSRNELSAIAVAPAPSPTGATPLAWIDDASLLPTGTISLSVSAMRWSGGGASEVDIPIIDAAVGLAPRLQLSASVPRVVGSAENGTAGGVGTTFFSAKVGLYEHEKHAFKVAASPTMLVLSPGVVDSLEQGQGRLRWGLPVSAEVSRGAFRVYGGGGYFSPGLWFTGVAVSGQAAEKVFLSGGVSRAWRHSDIPDVPMSDRDRKELSFGGAYVLRPTVTLFGSLGRTFKTLVDNGAGTSIIGGVSFSFVAAKANP